MNILLKKLAGFSIGPIVGALIAFITIPLTTYFVSPTEYGKASMFTVYQTLIVTFLYLGMDQSYTREYHESTNKINLLQNAMLFPVSIAIFIFILICCNLNSVSYLLFESDNYYLATLLFGLTIIFMAVERFILLSIRMEEKALEYSVVNILIKLTVLFSTLVFVLLISRDFLAVVYSTVTGQIIGNLYMIIRYRKYFNLNKFNLDKVLLVNLFKFGLPILMAASVTSLLNLMDRFALKAWSSFTELGIYTAALKIAATLSIIQWCFTSFWVPTAYRWYNQNKDIKHFEVVSNVTLLIMSGLFCFILLFKDIVIILLSPEYSDARYIIGFLCLQPIMYAISETTTLGIVFSKKSHLNVWVSLLSLIPNLVLNYLLVPSYGAIGAAFATGISFIIFFFGRSYFSKKHWIGFSLNNHILVTAFLLIGAFFNSQDYKYITLINLVLLILIIALQIPTIKKVVSIYKSKNNNEWDFS